jgi:Arc/MetJ-type ribon-helix-helix transcriptional regulator
VARGANASETESSFTFGGQPSGLGGRVAAATLGPASDALPRGDRARVGSDLISVRLDDNARRALAELEATGLSRSEAVRRGLVAAAQRLRDRQRLIDEVAELAIDEADRAEAAEVAAIMEDLRAPW